MASLLSPQSPFQLLTPLKLPAIYLRYTNYDVR